MFRLLPSQRVERNIQNLPQLYVENLLFETIVSEIAQKIKAAKVTIEQIIYRWIQTFFLFLTIQPYHKIDTINC